MSPLAVVGRVHRAVEMRADVQRGVDALRHDPHGLQVLRVVHLVARVADPAGRVHVHHVSHVDDFHRSILVVMAGAGRCACSFAGWGLPFRRRNPRAKITHEPASSGADRSTGRSGRGPALSHRPRQVRRRSQASTACCTRWCCAAASRTAASAASTQPPRERGRAFAPSSRRPRSATIPGDPAAARQPAGVQAVLSAGDRQRQGALRRRAAGRRGGGQPGARRGCARSHRGRDRAAAGGRRPAHGASNASLLFEPTGSNSRDTLFRRVRRRRRGLRQGRVHPPRELPLPSPDRGCRSRPAARSPNGTPTRRGSRSTAPPRCCSSTAASSRPCWASPRTPSTCWSPTSAAASACAASSIRRTSSSRSRRASPGGR